MPIKTIPGPASTISNGLTPSFSAAPPVSATSPPNSKPSSTPPLDCGCKASCPTRSTRGSPRPKMPMVVRNPPCLPCSIPSIITAVSSCLRGIRTPLFLPLEAIPTVLPSPLAPAAPSDKQTWLTAATSENEWRKWRANWWPADGTFGCFVGPGCRARRLLLGKVGPRGPTPGTRFRDRIEEIIS